MNAKIDYKICKACGNRFTSSEDICPLCVDEFRSLEESIAEHSIVVRCKYCGRPFVKHGRSTFCDGLHFSQCEVCGGPIPVDHYGHVENRTCSKECKKVLFKQIIQNKYGVDNIMKVRSIQKKNSESFKTHYGKNENPEGYQSLIEKRKNTNLDKYGYEFYQQSPEWKSKFKETCIQKWGTSAPLGSEELREKGKKTLLDRYGVEYGCLTPQCLNAEKPYFTKSKLNQQFASLLEEYGIHFEMEYAIHRYSYDFLLNDLDTVVEIDPTITHNSYMSIFDDSHGLDSTYHQEKSKLASENGLRCIHVFDWDDSKRIIEQLLSLSSTIYARKCEIQEISVRESNEFIDENHLQRRCRGNSVNLGLIYNDDIVEVMTFGEPRYNKNYKYELLRLCTRSNVRVVGGASKLWKYFLDRYNPQSVISYCDRSKFQGKIYLQLGMTLANITPPNRIWSYKEKRITNNLLMSRGYDQLFKTDYGKGMSNEELMIQNGWLPVYDCGQYVFSYNR